MHKQKGVSLSGLLIWSVILVLVALLGFKVGPAYMEYFSVRQQFKAIANDPAMSTGQRRLIETSFYNRAVIENIKAVTPQDLEIAKDGDGVVISAAYSVRVPLFGNISVCMDFFPTSAK
ncbi:MAG: DUF4845 domain-containing protein [Burkholderiales bacterium]|nr:DUF4845 domain-containing protein [Burkholderiales bacterium]